MNSKLILIFLSITFTALGILELMNLVNLTSIAYLGYSLSALFFVISDIFDEINEKIINIKLIDIYQFFIKLFAIMSIFVIPHIDRIEIVDNLKFAMIPLLTGLLFLIMSKNDIIKNLELILVNRKMIDTEDKMYTIEKKLKNIENSKCTDDKKDIIDEIIVKRKLNFDDDKSKKRFTLYDKIKEKK